MRRHEGVATNVRSICPGRSCRLALALNQGAVFRHALWDLGGLSLPSPSLQARSRWRAWYFTTSQLLRINFKDPYDGCLLWVARDEYCNQGDSHRNTLLALASTTSDARGPYGSINVGNWHGGAYTNDKNGSFSHCAAGASYQSGIYFVVSVGEDYSWRLGFAHENWQLTAGQAFALALTFDGQPAINVQVP